MKFWTVDVFSKEPFQGNAAGVILCEKNLENYQYELLALELFQSETAFIAPNQNKSGHFDIRFFTPHGENKSPGHSIFAAAHVLWEELKVERNTPIYFEYSNGLVQKITRDENFISIVLKKSEVIPSTTPDRLFKAVNTVPVSVSQCNSDLIVELHNEQELRDLEPNFAKIATIEAERVIVTCEAETADCDFVSRVFTPFFGNDEESINIQAQCDLACFWAMRLDKKTFKAKQLGNRSGNVIIQVDEDTVALSGEAVVVTSGMFQVAFT